jgi:hypothetical protein
MIHLSAFGFAVERLTGGDIGSWALWPLARLGETSKPIKKLPGELCVVSSEIQKFIAPNLSFTFSQKKIKFYKYHIGTFDLRNLNLFSIS